MIDYIYNPRTIIAAKRDYAAQGNRLNAVFMSNAMQDGDAVRKLIHNNRIEAPRILRAFYRYYSEHRDKEMLWTDINEVNQSSCRYGACGIYADTDDNGRKIITDRSYSWAGRESAWADLALYDVKRNVVIYEDFNSNFKKYENATVAEVLADTLKNRTYIHAHYPQTPNADLNLLLRNMYITQYSGERSPMEQVYYRALKLLNADLTTAFANKQKLNTKDYMPAIIFLDERANRIFNKIDYPRQRSFYKTPLGQESLKFTYLTALEISDFQKENMDNFLQEVKSQTLWQAAQKRITQEFVYWRFRHSVSANRWLELNSIKPLPKEKVYAPYHQTDRERAEYMNLYSVSAKQRI
ncbi:MAG: hypothetical protein IKN71_08515 [Alphaproteobacteria bacterium]|nr:hypothetical protein [Alphaproteobacteria bacterium]